MLKPSYIQSNGIYPSPRNTPFRLMGNIHAFDQAYTEDKSRLGYKTFSELGKDPLYSISLVSQTAHNFYKDSTSEPIMDHQLVTNLKDMRKRRDTSRSSARKDYSRAHSVGRTEERSATPLREQPLTLAYILKKGQQQIMGAMRNHGLDVTSSGLGNAISGVFEAMSAELKDAKVGFELGKQGKMAGGEFQRTMREIDGEFSQARQALSLSTKLATIQMDKLELDLNSLKGAMRTGDKRDYSRFTAYAAGLSERSSSQASKERTDSTASYRVSSVQKELAKLVVEIRKIDGKAKALEDLFARKDVAAQSILTAYKQSCDSPQSSYSSRDTTETEALISRKDDEIRRLKFMLETQQEASETRRCRTRFAVRPIIENSGEDSDLAAQLEKVCSEASAFLNAMEKLRRVIVKKDEASIERTKQELDVHKKNLSSLVYSSATYRQFDSFSGRFKASRTPAVTSRDSSQEIIRGLQRKQRELEMQYEKKSDEMIKYQDNLLGHIERIKRKDREIESLQQELISYREQLQTLQEDSTDRHARNGSQMLEIVKDTAAAMCSRCEGLEKRCSKRLGLLINNLKCVEEKMAEALAGRRGNGIDVEQMKDENERLVRENNSLKKKVAEQERKLATTISELEKEASGLRNGLEVQDANARDYISQMATIMKETFQERTAEILALMGEKMERIDSVKASFESILGLLSTQINEQVDIMEQLREENEALKQLNVAKNTEAETICQKHCESLGTMGEGIGQVLGLVVDEVKKADETLRGYNVIKEKMSKTRRLLAEVLLKRRDSRSVLEMEILQLRAGDKSGEELLAKDKEIEALKSKNELNEAEIEELNAVSKILKDENTELENKCKALSASNRDKGEIAQKLRSFSTDYCDFRAATASALSAFADFLRTRILKEPRIQPVLHKADDGIRLARIVKEADLPGVLNEIKRKCAETILDVRTDCIARVEETMRKLCGRNAELKAGVSELEESMKRKELELGTVLAERERLLEQVLGQRQEEEETTRLAEENQRLTAEIVNLTGAMKQQESGAERLLQENEGKVEDLVQELEVAKAELVKANQEKERLGQELAEGKAKMEKEKSDQVAEEKKVRENELAEENLRLKSGLEVAAAEKSALESRCADLLKENQRLEGLLNTEKEMLSKAEAEETEVGEFKVKPPQQSSPENEASEKLPCESEATLIRFAEMEEQYKNQLNEEREKSDTQFQSVLAMETRCEKLETKVKEKDGEIVALRTRLEETAAKTKIEQTAQDLEAEFRKTTEICIDLKRENGEMKEELERIQGKARDAEDKVHELEEGKELADRRMAGDSEQIAELSQENADLRLQCEELDGELESTKESLVAQISSFEAKIKTSQTSLTERIDSLEKAIDFLRSLLKRGLSELAEKLTKAGGVTEIIMSKIGEMGKKLNRTFATSQEAKKSMETRLAKLSYEKQAGTIRDHGAEVSSAESARLKQSIEELKAEQEHARSALIEIIGAQKLGQGKESPEDSLIALCDSVKSIVVSQAAGIRSLEESCAEIDKERAGVASKLENRDKMIKDCIGKLKTRPSFVISFDEILVRIDKKLEAIGKKENMLREALLSDKATTADLKETLAHVKNELSVLAGRIEEKSKEVQSQQERLQKVSEIAESKAKIIENARSELAHTIEDYGISLDEPQKNSLEELIKMTLSLLETTNRHANSNNPSCENEEKLRDELMLNDLDFNTGLVEEFGGSFGTAPKSSQGNIVPEEKKAELSERKPGTGEEEWRERETKLLKKIEELERSTAIKEDSDRLWHFEYEDLKEGIKRVIERYSRRTEKNVEYTIEKVDNMIRGLVEQIETLQKEKEGDGDSKQELILKLNGKLVESSTQIEKLRQGLSQSQKELEENKKAVIGYWHHECDRWVS